MAIFNSYVKLPEGTLAVLFQASRRKLHRPGPALQGLRWPWFRWPQKVAGSSGQSTASGVITW